MKDNAQAAPDAVAEPQPEPAAVKPKPFTQESISETQHTVVIGGEAVTYTATAGTLVLKTDAEEPKASVFFVAYTRAGGGDPAQRPVTFSFNGGPGSSSVWLHLGVLGPRRVLMDAEGFPLPPPARLVDNEYSLLDVTDLVFIDPVSTGYSRVPEGEEAKDYHSLESDIEAVGEVIRRYTTRFRRWASPKFLIGESYGTTRAAGLAGFLQNRYGMYLNGVMLISVVLDFQTIRFDVGNDLPYILYLPTYAATAWYHGCLDERAPGELPALLKEVEAFALGEYTLALMQGDALPAAQRQAIAAKLSAYTGLSVDYLERANLRIDIMRFVKELLRERRRTVGRLDARFTGIDRDAVGESFEFDPSYAAIQGTYSGAFNHYVRAELEFESDLLYEVLGSLYQSWSYDKHQNRYVNVAETLRAALCQNPHLKVFVANGYFDMATPHLATEYTFNHMQLDASLRDNLSMAFYESGHMMYVQLASLIKLKADLAAFIRAAIPAE